MLESDTFWPHRHISALVELRRKSELFYCAHKLVEAYPDRGLSWFAVGRSTL